MFDIAEPPPPLYCSELNELHVASNVFKTPIADIGRTGDNSLSMTLHDEILAIISRLREPVSEADAHEGWDADLKGKWERWYSQLDLHLSSGQGPDSQLSTARAMDFDGVGLTALSHRAARIDVRLNNGERYS